jgi:putative ATPase
VLAAKDAYDFLALRGRLAIVQACLYCATAPEIQRRLFAQRRRGARLGKRIADAAAQHPQRSDEADEGHRLRQGYAYDHDAPEGFSGDDYWPEEMSPQTFYSPTDRGFEKRIAERIAWWEERRAEARK